MSQVLCLTVLYRGDKYEPGGNPTYYVYNNNTISVNAEKLPKNIELTDNAINVTPTEMLSFIKM